MLIWYSLLVRKATLKCEVTESQKETEWRLPTKEVKTADTFASILMVKVLYSDFMIK